MILMNPLYNGWIRRHRRSDRESRKPAPWRANPPVSDELWARVEDVRRAKTRGGGPKRRDRVDLLGGLLECVCGRRLRNDGTFADGRHRKLHADPCEAWGTQGPPRRRDVGGADPGAGRGHRARRRHHRRRRRRPSARAAAGRDRPGADRPPDPRARAGARRRPPRGRRPTSTGCKALREAQDGSSSGRPPTGPGRARRRVAAAPSATWSERPTSPRRRQTCSTPSTTGSSSQGRRSCRSGSRRRPTRTDWRWRCPKRLQWRARQDSNLRPSAPEADALSTELQARGPR